MTPTIMSKFKGLVNFALLSIVIQQEILQIWGEGGGGVGAGDGAWKCF